MKRFVVGLTLALSCFAASALSVPKVGSIDFTEGSVSVSRNGKLIDAPDIGDPLFSGDLIRTQQGGRLVIAMDRNTGMGGTLTVKGGTTLYLNLEVVKGEPRTAIQLLTGSVASSVSKLVGSPTVNVSTSSAVMAVRGTVYEVAVSVNADDANDGKQAVLVSCSESKVAVNDGQGEVEVPAGKVLEKRPGARLRFLPVADSSVAGFGEKWIADEVAAFKADAPRALAAYAKRYKDLSAKFEATYAPFGKSPTPRKWADEDRSGAKVDPLDAAVLREKKEIAGYLLELRKVLFIFERVYYRVDEIAAAIADTPDEGREILPGVKAGDFLRKLKADRDGLAAKVSRFHYIEALFKQRSPEGEALDGDDAFFATPDGF
jgi:FecR protein.